MSSDATMTISRENGVLHSISLVMPVWIKNDGILTIDLPFFKTKTYARTEAEVDKAIEEAVKSFCIASERFGKGVEKELELLGWEKVDDTLGFNLPQSEVMDQILHTGVIFAINNAEINLQKAA